ncbi:14951_t:CDS:1, partial [Racocetra fulgida]
RFMGKWPKGNRNSSLPVDGEFENVDDPYGDSDDELAAEKIRNGKN